MGHDLAVAGARLLGTSPAFVRAVEEARRVAPRDGMHVLILGANGTGKEEFAKFIHAESPRHAKPLVVVNCAAIAKELFESELFGHARGAFTGAVQAKKGRFELADGGTLFLDEIGELALEHQAKLLRAIQQQEIWRVGAEKPMQVDVRVIAATNRDLWAVVKQGGFREDLYFRLAAWTLRLPALRDRGDDVLKIAREALDQKGFDGARLSPDAEQLLMRYAWPGNIRELVNAVCAGAVRAGDDVISPDHLLPALVESSFAPGRAPRNPTDAKGGSLCRGLHCDSDAAAVSPAIRAAQVARALLRRSGYFTRADFEGRTGLSKTQAKAWLQHLAVEQRLIKRSGNGPATRYVGV